MTSPDTSREHTPVEPDGAEPTDVTSTSGVLVHTRQERELAVGTWLLLSADSSDQARREWKEGGIALLRCGTLFAAVRMNADLVHAAAGSDDPETVKAYLANVLHGGPVFVDQNSRLYYALMPSSTADRREWVERRHVGAECLGPDSFLGVPRPDLNDPNEAFSYWAVPMDGPGDLCPVKAVSQLVTYGRDRLAVLEGDGGE
ncbi:hypothetical protein RFN58_35830 [Streptomyces iakyrus]|uniref:hypothetical protein n=1 Tax=Streptomyces iakyrus TaxID=68219 RepID=UPI000A8EB0EA|nr:hypothetical protein [Streptomyces iakyrus]